MRRVLVVAAACTALSSCGDDREVRSIGAVAVEGNRIAAQGSCNSGRRLEAHERDEVVELTMTVEAVDGGDCFDCVDVDLASDVGDREVIDTATDRSIPRDAEPALHECFDIID